MNQHSDITHNKKKTAGLSLLTLVSLCQVIYDWNNWGCVLKIHFQSAFKPALDL